jgi:hypothetical protein
MSAWRRLAAVGVIGAIAAALVAVDRRDPEPVEVVFGSATAPVQPVAPTGDALTTVWFCPGIPADADGSASGTVAVLNPSEVAMTGSVTFVPFEADPVVAPIEVAPRSRTELRPPMAARFVAVQVEVFGTNAVVEQTTVSRAGTSLTPCASAASPTWYAPDGTTTADAQLTLLVWNPFPDEAIVDIGFATEEGTRTPQALQGYVVPARTLRLVDVDQAVQRNELVATSVEARSGRVVVGRYQTHRSLRRGLVAGLVSPSPGTTWLFPGGDKGEAAVERIVILNPGDDDAEVDVTLYPADPAAALVEPISLPVAAGGVEVVDISATDFVPDGVHSLQVTAENGAPIVVERILDRGQVSGNIGRATTSQPGSLLTGGRWFLPSSPVPGSGYVVTVANATGTELRVTLAAIGPAGAVAVAGFDQVVLPAAGTLRLDLSGNPATASPLVVEADGPVAVDRLVIPPGEGTGATAALAIVQG